MEQITVNKILVDVIHKNIKNIHLGVYPQDGKFWLVVPLNIEDDGIRLFVISKLSWRKKQIQKFEHQERLTKREFKQQKAITLKGIGI